MWNLLVNLFINREKKPGMKKIYILSVLIFFSVAALSQKQLTEKDDLYYKNDMLYSGTHKEYFDNGNLRISMHVKDGVKDGEVFLYHKNGHKKELRTYKNGNKSGKWVTWNKAGTKTGLAFYDDNKKDSTWYIWDENGTKRFEMYYEDGRKSGVWKMWDEDGNLINTREF